MSSPDLDERDVAAVLDVMRSTSLSIGPRVVQFENAIAECTGAAHAAAVSSGTAGLHLALIAAEVDAGDLVITTPFSFIASSNVILYQRGIPVFVDVDPVTGNVDPRLVAEAADDLAAGGERARRWLPRRFPNATVGTLKAVLPVHAFGQPADMDPLVETARHHRLALIEDSCEALGAEYRGRQVGTIGDAGVFAFYPNKQITTGEGGAIVTNRAEWDTLFRSLRNQGRDVFDAWLSHSRLGFNYRLDELSSALGASQVARLDEIMARRARVAAWYDELLAEIDGVNAPEIVPDTTRMSWFVYVVRARSATVRQALLTGLAERGIPSRVYFNPIHLQPFYREQFGYQRGDFPVTEQLGDTCLALPFSSVMARGQVEETCAAVREVLAEAMVARAR